MTIELRFLNDERRRIEDPNYDVTKRPRLIVVDERFFTYVGHGYYGSTAFDIFEQVEPYQL